MVPLINFIKLCLLCFIMHSFDNARADLDDLEDLNEVEEKPRSVSPKPKKTKPSRKKVKTTPLPKAQQDSKPDLNPELKENSEKSQEEEEQLLPPSPSRAKNRIRTRPEEEDTTKKHPVRLKSMGLRAQKDGGIVELQKNVQITQGPLSLSADYSKVFLDPVTNEVITANADGNVRMNKTSANPGEVIKAKSKSAIFMNKERKVILKGNAQLWRGSSLLKGKKIIYDLATGWITFDGAEGVMQPEGN